MNIVYEILIGPYKQIGSTCNLKRRMNVHLSYLRRNLHSNSMMQNVWNKYQTFECKIISEHTTREEAYAAEQILLTEFFKKPFYMMLNSAACGTAKGRISPMKGKICTAEHIKNRVKSRLDNKQPMTEEQRFNCSKAHNNFKVLQFSKDDILIKTWECLAVVKRDLMQYDYASIARCCQGHRQTAYGFKWKYKQI